jgi:septal ring factor EnvC (AmiA/AmiB activator)
VTEEQYGADIAALEKLVNELERELLSTRRALEAAYEEIDELEEELECLRDE